MEHSNSQTPDAAAFARVWSRVSAAGGGGGVQSPQVPQPSPPDTEEFLRRRIRAALTTSQTCAKLAYAGLFPPLLRTMAGEELYAARRLSTALFLRAGEKYFPRGECGALTFSDGREGMRQLYLRAQEEAEEFRQAAQQNRDPTLTQLLHTLGEESALHALRIQTALERWG